MESTRAGGVKGFKMKRVEAQRRKRQQAGGIFATTLSGLAMFAAGCSPSSVPSLLAYGWPKKPIAISCSEAAGGKADAVSHMIARLMEAQLGVSVSVVNRTGNQGGDAINYTAAQERDGYHWGSFSRAMLTASVSGLAETVAADWTFFLIAGAPGVISTPQNSQYRTLRELTEAAKASPKTVKVATAPPGSLSHIKLLALQAAAKAEFQHIPCKPGSLLLQSAFSNGADVVLASLSEQAEWIRKRALRPLAMVEAESFLFPGLAKMPVNQFFAIAVPANTLAGVLSHIAAAFEKAMASNTVKIFCEQQQLVSLGWHGEEANR